MTAANKTNPVSLLLLMDSCQKHRRALWGNKRSVTDVGFCPASAWRAGSLRLVSVNVLFVAPAQAFTVPEVGKRQLNEINRIRYELELMAVALAVENLTMQKNVAMLCQQYSR